MAWIRMVSDDEASGPIKRTFDECLARAGKIWNIIRLTSIRPQATQASLGIYTAVMFCPSELSRSEREMLAVVVSKENACHY